MVEGGYTEYGYRGLEEIKKANEKIVELKLGAEEKENFKKSVMTVQELYNAAKKIDQEL